MRILLVLTLLLVQACAGQEAQTAASSGKLTFIHLNDTYRIDALEEGTVGGFARVATIIRDLKSKGHDVHILHAGDFLYPSLESKHFQGKQMIEAMNYLQDLAPMYVVPGNHEFDSDDPQVLVDRVNESEFAWLSNNIRFGTGQRDVDTRPQTEFTFVAAGKTIGIFALTLKPDEIGDMPDYAVFTGDDYKAIAESAIKRLQELNADLIIGLTHLTLAQDQEIASLKARYPEFLFIAGGHEHAVQYGKATRDEALIVKGDSNARRIWQIDVEFPGNTPVVRETLIDVGDNFSKDPDYAYIQEKWEKKLQEVIPFLKVRFGDTAVRLDGRESTIRTRDSGWGMFIADQMENAFPRQEVDFALVNSGSLRIDDYIEADITWEDVARTFAYPSALRYMEIAGEDFRELLENGYRGDEGEGYFPQISGFRVCVDRSRDSGERIVQLQVPAPGGWLEIDDDSVYVVVAPDFIVRGGDKYDFSEALHTSPASAELKYLVLDGIVRATAEGEKIGTASAGQRYVKLAAGEDACFAQ
jgi:5'-nucleotidase